MLFTVSPYVARCQLCGVTDPAATAVGVEQRRAVVAAASASVTLEEAAAQMVSTGIGLPNRRRLDALRAYLALLKQLRALELTTPLVQLVG